MFHSSICMQSRFRANLTCDHILQQHLYMTCFTQTSTLITVFISTSTLGHMLHFNIRVRSQVSQHYHIVMVYSAIHRLQVSMQHPHMAIFYSNIHMWACFIATSTISQYTDPIKSHLMCIWTLWLQFLSVLFPLQTPISLSTQSTYVGNGGHAADHPMHTNVHRHTKIKEGGNWITERQVKNNLLTDC